jgi:hypothetical protein
MSTQDESKRTSLSKSEEGRPASMGRRAILRGGVTAMPAILTLHSGAALARTSNLISASPGARDINQNVWCLDTSTAVDYYPDSGKYDFGDPGYATVNVFPDTVYESGTGQSKVSMTADQFCASGGSANYHLQGGGSPTTVTLQSPGIVVSSNAYNSLSPRINIGEPIDWTRLT